VAGAASDYLLRVLQPGDVLGVSGGESVTLTAQFTPASAVENVTVVQLGSALAYLGEGAASSSAEVALQLAQKLGSMDRLVLIPVPSLLDNETIRDTLLRDTGVRRVMALLTGCTIALVGIGTLDTEPGADAAPPSVGGGYVTSIDAPPAQRGRPRLSPITEDESIELRNVGAVGEICARFFDVEGRPCVTSLDRRMVALDLSQLRAVPLAVGVASGVKKARAILGAVRGGYVKSLITDDVTAMEVLALAGAVTTRERKGREGCTPEDASCLTPTAGQRQERAPVNATS
jgi:DNA-binding transcriptional regulator LsrR (DeoR family)